MARARLLRTVTAIAALAAALAAPPARAEALSTDESARLERGETVTREQTIDDEERRLVGGVTYTIVEASPEELGAMLEDVRSYQKVLPRTKRARLVGQSGPDFFVELLQGNSVVETAYTLRVRRDETGRQFRFWLDRSKPHEMADAWGFFRYEPLSDSAQGTPRVLLTYGILVDFGPGLVRDLFEDHVRALMLSVPQLVRRHIQDTLRAGNGS